VIAIHEELHLDKILKGLTPDEIKERLGKKKE